MTILRIALISVVIATAITLYGISIINREDEAYWYYYRPNAIQKICEWTTIPGYFVACIVLPKDGDDIKGESLIPWVAIPVNIVFWTTASIFVSIGIRSIRTK